MVCGQPHHCTIVLIVWNENIWISLLPLSIHYFLIATCSHSNRSPLVYTYIYTGVFFIHLSCTCPGVGTWSQRWTSKVWQPDWVKTVAKTRVGAYMKCSGFIDYSRELKKLRNMKHTIYTWEAMALDKERCTAQPSVAWEWELDPCIKVAFAVMAPLSTIVLPLPPHAPPSGYGWSDRPLSALSTTTAFRIGLDQRDQFLGECRCVICGIYGIGSIEHCHIIMDSEPHTVSQNGIWALLRLICDTVERPQGPRLDPWAGQSRTPSWTARWHDYVCNPSSPIRFIYFLHPFRSRSEIDSSLIRAKYLQ